MKKLIYLQIARGIAALIVVFHHITASGVYYFDKHLFGGVFKAGWNAVDFFFVLSGFIIYYAHSGDLGRKSEWRRYFSKRLLRIYPIYWVVAGIGLALLSMKSGQVSGHELPAFVSPSTYVLKSLLLIPQRIDPFLVVAWSLCYEMFFYIMFGLGILAGRRVLWIFIVVYLALLGYQIIYPSGFENNPVLPFLASNYHLEFLLGIFTAYLIKPDINGHTLWSDIPAHRWLLATGLVLFIGTWMGSLYFETVFSKFSLYSRLLYGTSSCLIIGGIAQLKFPETKASATTRFFLLLGDSSYVLYLIHPIVLAILFKVITNMGFHGKNVGMTYGVYLAAALFCILAGFILHIKVEKKILLATRKFSHKQ